MAKTRRSPDGIFAGPGAVSQHDGNLPIYICNVCDRDVVWATSTRTGRKYLANVARKANGARFYIAANLHKCEGGDFDKGLFDSSVRTDIENADAYQQHLDDADESDADEYSAHVASLVRTAYAAREKVGETDRGSYYDTTTYGFVVPLPGITAKDVRAVLSARDGESMYAYGSFGGYSTVGNVVAFDHESGLPAFTVESVYHIGD